jgi:hypothetical protein
LALNQLEYKNENFMTPRELQTFFRTLGAKDFLISTHITNQRRKEPWAAIVCANLRSMDIPTYRYAFRIVLPNAYMANQVYSRYLEQFNSYDTTLTVGEATIALEPPQQIKWDRNRGYMYRPLSEDELPRRRRQLLLLSIRVGNTEGNTEAQIIQAFADEGYHNAYVELSDQDKVIEFELEDTAELVHERFSPTARGAFSLETNASTSIICPTP